ncbi:ribosomal protein L7/L12 [Cryptosporangium minutisporangium]|uniref:Large ribosomal subunit protein bL12 C-terminal domain-containing protein n=1 Tax=Cryptosporangium minutisporangium TaxID=113569 RepID=A0ABP6SU46_9ACTN
MDYVLLVALVIAVIGLGLLTASLAGRDRREHRTARQLASVERKLDVIIAHLGIDLPREAYPEVLALLRKGEKIAAIKAYREQTGAGLKEAKDAVEHMEREPVEPAPEPRPASEPRPAPEPRPASEAGPAAEKQPAAAATAVADDTAEPRPAAAKQPATDAAAQPSPGE